MAVEKRFIKHLPRQYSEKQAAQAVEEGLQEVSGRSASFEEQAHFAEQAKLAEQALIQENYDLIDNIITAMPDLPRESLFIMCQDKIDETDGWDLSPDEQRLEGCYFVVKQAAIGIKALESADGYLSIQPKDGRLASVRERNNYRLSRISSGLHDCIEALRDPKSKYNIAYRAAESAQDPFASYNKKYLVVFLLGAMPSLNLESAQEIINSGDLWSHLPEEAKEMFVDYLKFHAFEFVKSMAFEMSLDAEAYPLGDTFAELIHARFGDPVLPKISL